MDQFAYLEVSVKDEDIIMTLFESLPTSFEYLISALETMLMKKLAIDYVMARLMHKLSNRKENEPQGKDAAMVLRQSKGSNLFLCQDTKSYFYCDKLGHIAHFCYKTNNKERGNARNAMDDGDYAFKKSNEVHSKNVYK